MIWVAIMATIGIGGGFAGLTWGWLESERAMRRERQRCRWFGWCEFNAGASAGRVFAKCPCVDCRTVRLQAEVVRFNASLERYRRELRRMAAETMQAVAELGKFGDAVRAAQEPGRRSWLRGGR